MLQMYMYYNSIHVYNHYIVLTHDGYNVLVYTCVHVYPPHLIKLHVVLTAHVDTCIGVAYYVHVYI